MHYSVLFVIFIIGLAYCFDFINGIHDASNGIACIIASKVLSPRQAVIWGAFFTFMGIFLFNLSVARTISLEIINPALLTPDLVCAALCSAILWGLITWYFGLPSSSSQALMGGILGAALIKHGSHSLQYMGVIKLFTGILISPTLGVFLSHIVTHGFDSLKKIMTNSLAQKRLFNTFQLFSSASLCIAHGGNDAQKTMGIITLLLFQASWLTNEFYIPFWVIVSCYACISLGSLLGGWRIVRTMINITPMDSVHASAAETSAACIIMATTHFGIPLSTTQIVTGAITGTGIKAHMSQTNWLVLKVIFFSWIITLPSTATLAALLLWIA